MKAKTLSSCILLLAVAACQQMTSTVQAAVTFSVTPSAVSNFYAGPVTLQIGGLNPGETVQLDKFLDANGNGVLDGADLPVQSFLLTDGQASVFYDGATAVTNINVPGDFNPAAGAITTRLSIASDITQQIVAQYLFRLSSPTSRFTPITNLFNVTNSAYAQSFTGAVRNSGTNVPNVVVMVAQATSAKGGPFAGVMANNTGNYTLNLPGGTYSFWLFKSNFVANLSKSPLLTLTNGATLTTNLNFLIPATNSISGHLVDAANTNTGVPNVFMVCQSSDGQFMAGACYTGTNGAFTVPVIAGQWGVSMDSQGLAAYGYLGPNNNLQVNATAGSVSGVTLALPRATALFYGSVLDNQGHPLAGIDISCWDNNNEYYQDYYTDANGYFVAPVVGGSPNDGWQVEISSDTAPAGYLFTQPAFNQNGGTNLNAGQALLVNFTAVLATNHISGWLKDSGGNPIAGVGVWADATINGVYYNQGSVDTDANGNYSLNVANGTWTVGVNSGGGGDSLSGNYLAPANQTVVIANNNGTANFTALLVNNYISGHVQQSNGNPISGVGVWASATVNGVNYFQYTDTDATGNYSLGVINGNWTVGVECGSNGGDGLDDILGGGNYQCPNQQSVNIYNGNGTANFTVQPFVPLQMTTSSLPGGTVGVYYDQSLGASGGQPPYNWWLPDGTSTLPPGTSGDMNFSNDGTDGTISGTPGTAGTFSFWVGVSDNASPPNVVTQMFSITITGGSSGPLQITTTALPDGIVGGDYNLPLNASGGQSPYSWSLTPGSLALPGGLNLSNGGIISGTPTNAPFGGTNYYFSVRVTDNVANTVDQLLSLTIYPALTMSANALPNGTIGVAYSAQILVSGGDSGVYFGAPYYYAGPGGFITSGSLPPGLNVSDGAITSSNAFFVVSGTPTNSGTFSFTMGVYDGDANWVQNNYSITITSSSLQITTASLSNATVGSAYTNQLQASGGTTPYTWTIANGSQPLPSALTLSTTGLISGVPASSGANSFIVRLTDHNSLTVTRALTLITNPKPALSLPVWLNNRFQMRLTGAANQNYTIQMSTNLSSTNWISLFITNNTATNSFLLADPNATNNQRFYRVKVGP